MSLNEADAALIEKTIEEHNDKRGWEIDSYAHGLGMILCDLIEWAEHHSLDFDLAVEQARETLRDCA